MHLFCPSSSAWQSEGFVNRLRAWLASQGKTKSTTKQLVVYAKKYGHILDTADASQLLLLSPRNKQHAMTALANLAKFQGRYDQFLQLRQRYNLKWSSGNNSLQSLQRFFNPDLTLEVMIQRVREMIDVLPASMGEIVKFGVIVGLRPSEIVESVRLLNKGEFGNSYYNPEQQTLEHFRFPDIFVRQTKKAYISFITLDNLQPIVNLGCKTPTWGAIRLTCRRKGINCNMHYCRKLFASHLRQSGVQPEVVDLLQGRVSPSVLTRHYLVPAQGLKDQVLQALDKLRRQL